MRALMRRAALRHFDYFIRHITFAKIGALLPSHSSFHPARIAMKKEDTAPLARQI